MKKILLLLLALTFFSFAEEDKHPWYLDIKGNKAFSNYQLEEQLDIPEEFGKMDTTKQDFMMRLSLENIKALYYSRGYYSLSLTMRSLIPSQKPGLNLSNRSAIPRTLDCQRTLAPGSTDH